MQMNMQQVESPKTVNLVIYDIVRGGEERQRSGERVESKTSDSYVNKVLETASAADTIQININSWGGDVKTGLGIYHQLKRHPAHKVAYIDGFACSIASVIPMAANRVIMPKSSVMMIHHAALCTFGNATELRKAAGELEIINELTIQAYLERTNGRLSRDELVRMMDQETYLTAEQCIKYGFADAFADMPSDRDVSNGIQEYQAIAANACLAAQDSVRPELNNFNKLFHAFLKEEQK